MNTHPPHPTGLTDGYQKWRINDVQNDHWVQYDLQRAAALLDQAGWTLNRNGVRTNAKGERLSLTLQGVSGWSDWVRAVQVISRNLKSIGVDVQLVSYDFGAWFHRTQTGDFDLTMGWADEGPAPYDVYKALMSPSKVKPLGEPSPNNWHRFAAAEMTELESRFEKTTDFETQYAIGVEMQRILERAPAIPLFAAPAWGESNSTRFSGFPSEDNPYARLSPKSSSRNPFGVDPIGGTMSGRFGFIIRRLLFYILAAWVALTLNFIVPRLMPGDPASNLFAKFQGNLKPEAMEALKETF